MNKSIVISLITAAGCLISCSDKEQAYIANETEKITILNSETTESPETESTEETTTTDYVALGMDIVKATVGNDDNNNTQSETAAKSTYNLNDNGFWWANLEPDDIHDAVAESFMAKDHEKIKSFFCPKSVETHDLDAEIDKALSLIEGDIVSYKTDYNILWSSGYSYREGHMAQHYSTVHVKGLITDANKTNEVVFILVDVGPDQSEIGIQCMTLYDEHSYLDSDELITIGECFDATRRAEEREKIQYGSGYKKYSVKEQKERYGIE